MENDHYSADWKTVDSLEAKGLPKSALEKVYDIYAKATKKNNQPQQAKCLIYKGKFMTQLEEDGFVKAINQFALDEKLANPPMKSLIQSMLAEQYSTYLQRNRYRFNNRTETPEFKTDDIRTWTIGQLAEESRKYFLKSVEDETSKNIKIQDWSAILRGGQNVDNLRPTLYDFLANRALDFLRNEQNYLTDPVYKFYIDQPEAFADAKVFSQFKFQTKDSTSSKYQTILLFQNIIAHHLNDDMPDALIDVDIKRLGFVRGNGVMDGKDDLYLKALENLSTKYDDYEASTEVQYWMARYYMDKGNKYQPNPDDIGKFDLKKAHEICEKAIQKSKDSHGGKQCQNLLLQIERKNLRVQMEQVNLPNEPMLASISYKNLKKVYGKIIRLEEKDRRKMQGLQNQNKLIPFLNEIPAIKTWTTDLPQVGDYRDHVVEVKVDAMPLGFYIVMMADNAEFSEKEKAVSFLSTHVSNISFWTRKDEDNISEFFVVHRETGEPMSRVKANYFVREYNSENRKYDYINRGEGFTNKDGYLKPLIGDQNNFQIRWSQNDDVLNLDESYSNYTYRNRNRSTRKQMSFFLDRMIYRPGQTVYFKGLLTEFDSENIPSILPNQKVQVIFYDVNSQEVEKKTLTTNEFGTINGSFQAPRTGLLGQMRIQAAGFGNKYFRVEEYKRPKFEVNFDPVAGSFKIGDEVKISGHAKAFAGSNVDGAKVNYRVVRETIYPYWGWSWRYFPPAESMEITNGETITDAEGKYNITFTAVPDRSADAKNKPQFTYRVYADVVDITGETHSTQTNVSVGHIALSIDISIPKKLDRNGLREKEFKISSKNLNGEFENSQGEITIHELKNEHGILRKKYFPQPDQFLMGEADFKKSFPLDIYHDEDKIENWIVGKEVMKTRFDASRNPSVSFGNPNWNIGSYVLTLNTQDKFGEKIELKRYFTIYDLKGKKIPSNMLSFDSIEKEKYEPGEVANYYFGSAYREIKVLHEVEFKNKIIDRKWLTINQVKDFQLQIEEKHRGNIGYHISFVKNNRNYTSIKTINVPWSNKDLKFEYSTFRDKLKPGQEEEWRVKISGNKKDKVAAEMVAAMYDASLDQFAPNFWNLNMYPTHSTSRYLRSGNFTSTYSQLLARNWHKRGVSVSRSYRYLDWFGFSMNGYGRRNRRFKSLDNMANNAPSPMSAEPEMAEMAVEDAVMTSAGSTVTSEQIRNLPTRDISAVAAKTAGLSSEEESDLDFSDVKVRTNLNETVFFMPELMTDENGDVIIKFTMNEALTRWKFLGLAHTKDLEFGITQNEIVTQKELMVIPNAPRFMREGDVIEYAAKVSNLTEKELSGSAKLELFDAVTNEPINLFIERKSTTLPFTVGAGQSASLSWKLKIPFGKVMAITHRVVAQAGDFSDGEESSLPVLTNRMLVTETMPLPVRGKETKTFSFDRMKNANSTTLQNHELTLEFTSNPAWYAVQALPYLMEYPHACTEQIFNRYYANSLATNVANSHPKVKTIFEKWKNTDAMLSNLSKNQELKSALLEETPWVLAAQSEEQQKKNIGLLFDLNRMSQERADAVATIAERQLGNGGFSWFPGGRDSWYITQYIVEGMGHLNELGVDDIKSDAKVQKMLNRAIVFIDQRIAEQYEELLKRVEEGKTKLEDNHLNNMAIHYLYARSFFTNQQMNGNSQKAHNYYLGQAEKYWLKQGMYQEGMLTLALHRNGRKSVTNDMIKSFKERSLNNDEMGMYWKYDRGYYWYQLPIETHALMIEVFDEVANDSKTVDDLKVWLLKTKQTTHWKTTKATSAAVYALLRRGANWLLEDTPVEITLGNKKIDQSKMDTEAGTGYFKTKWSGEAIDVSMAHVKVENPNSVVAWGALYWQYFEDLDKITSFEDTPLKLNKKLFKMVNSDRGLVMTELKEGSQLSPGDKLQVRIELRVDRPMEYVHMKDMRASGFEPINVLSQYKWQGGLGYYESTKDASTNFFISYLPKGTFVFEYPMVVNHKGDFSNGVTTIQCMYAPEFTSHSEGIRVKVQ
ncbi:MAG: alpha-2-macroglobulin [Saprospiraceae bacterium]